MFLPFRASLAASSQEDLIPRSKTESSFKTSNVYKYEPEKWDLIVSNPPFTNKKAIFERANSFNKPYCLLMTLAWLNDSAPKKIWKDRDLQLLMFEKRVNFKGMGKNPTFSSAYYCYKFLPKQIIMRDFNGKQMRIF